MKLPPQDVLFAYPSPDTLGQRVSTENRGPAGGRPHFVDRSLEAASFMGGRLKAV